ncbi:MAG: NAD(+)/NADH kinase [Chlorobiaceae bacterium]|jgi:NAD+ kinase|nr:NAD(+)/NADH kinase [Chlorobiaceae bacterium]NTW63466.1 NAD(+)/NADH kinase [Chlorobiaceae bacterium]
MKFGIVINTSRERAIALARDLMAWLSKRGHDYIFDTASAIALQIPQTAPIEELNKQCDAFVSLGGDGTLLFTSHYSVTKPVIGINVGYLGFLTEFSPDEMVSAIEKVLSGNYSIHNRSQLEATFSTNGRIEQLRALNDVVIEKGTYPRIPTFVIKLDGELLGSYRADGIIIATSTGSTAYSMSAGGPIIAPKSSVFVITPICPHMLTIRPIVINDEKIIQVSIDAPDGEFPLNGDGHLRKLLAPQEVVTVKKSQQVINLVANENRDYCEILRTKLLWGREHDSNQ